MNIRKDLETIINDVNNGIDKLNAIEKLKERGADTFITTKELKNLGINVGSKNSRPSYMRVNPVYETFEVKTELYKGAKVGEKAIENGSYQIAFDNGVVKTLDVNLAKELGMKRREKWSNSYYTVNDDYNVIIKAKRCYYVVSEVIDSLENFLKNNNYYSKKWFLNELNHYKTYIQKIEEDVKTFKTKRGA